ncbi:MAG TPA: hypothetical protein VF039_11470 [Longimicrobiales bacterium]
MAIVLVEFINELHGRDDTTYEARACARERDDGLWEGWVEFLPQGGGEPLRTGRETTQPNEADVRYWATGLTGPYLEGALSRAEGPAQPATPRPQPSAAKPHFDGPAERAGASRMTRAILDPFEVYGSGGDGLLQKQLSALDEANLRNIVRAHRLSDESPDALRRKTRVELVGTIVAAVEKRAGVA